MLSYDEEYFQRFEPLSVGDMMKRVPGVSFQSDIGEYAEPSLRGIGSEYTQILVNGRRVTGGTNDNTVIVDRIPAELVERVEIIRSPSSDIDSQGVGGTLNIILKEGAELSGGIYRARGLLQRRRDQPERVPVLRRQQRQLRMGHVPQLPGALQPQGGLGSRARARRRGRRGAGLRRGGRGPGRAREHRHRLDRRRSAKLGRGRASGTPAPSTWTSNRAETEIGREFEAEDDDGEFETEAEQANQLDDFHERNYGVFTGYETGIRRRPCLGDRARPTTRPNSTASRRNWVDDLDFDFDAAGISDADSLLDFLDQSDQEINPAVRGRAAQCRGPARRRDSSTAAKYTDADDAELVLKTSADFQLGGFQAEDRRRGLRPQRDFSFRVFEMDDGVLEEDDDGLSLFDAKDQRANGFVKWTMDFGSSRRSSSAPAASSRASTSTRRCPRRSPRRPTSSRRSASSSTATRSSHRGHLRVQPERALALGRHGPHAGAPVASPAPCAGRASTS